MFAMHLAAPHGPCLVGHSVSSPSAASRNRPRAPPRTARGAALWSALVVGGTGRVGGSTTRWLRKLAEKQGLDLELSVGGRSRENYESFRKRWTGGEVPGFVQIDHTDPTSIRGALSSKKWSLVLHTAGPFQRVKEPKILKEALRLGLPYVDVCDDTDLCTVAKDLSTDAERCGVPAVVSAGIWPGVSALMVCEARERLGDIEDLTMSFYTAGTGGAGPTIVSATFLLLAEPPLNYKAGVAVRSKAWGNRRQVDFGPGVGKQPVHLLDEPEVYTCHKYLGIPNVSSSFGTAPDVWNWMFGACAKVIPAEVLANRSLMQNVAIFSMPIIQAVDLLVGARNAMRIDAVSRDGKKVTLRVTHEDLEDCVGLATAAFGLEVLEAKVPPGVWFPVEMAANRATIFERVKHGSVLWDM